MIKKSQKELADQYRTTTSNIQNIVKRTRDKLKTEEFEIIIENFYTNM